MQAAPRTPLQVTKFHIKNLTSSSLKKRKFKEQDCKYCFRFKFNRQQLEAHLKASENCQLLYQREWKLNSIEGVLMKIYRCLSCTEKGNFQLKRHLNENENCFKFYKERYKVKSWEEIKSKMFNYTRSAHASRSSAKRKLENNLMISKKKSSITTIECLNKFRQETAFSNYRLCISCEQHFMQSGAIEVLPEDEKYTEFELENKASLKRLNKFWICHLCLASSKKIESKYSTPKMSVYEEDGRKIIYPSSEEQTDDIEISMDTLIMIAKNCSAVTVQPNNFSLKMYVLEEPSNKILTTHYDARLSKFYQRKLNFDTYEGVIDNNEQRILSSAMPVYDDSNIKFSDSWHNKKRSTLYSYFHQNGQFAIAYNFDIELDNIETISTLLLCGGRVITVEYIGNENDEYVRKYFIHDHTNSQMCTPSCIKTEVKNIGVNLPVKCIPTYLSSVSQKQSAFIECLIKNKNFALNSEHYYSGIDFHLDGRAR